MLCYNFILHGNGWTLFLNILNISVDYENHIIEVITFSYHGEIGQQSLRLVDVFWFMYMSIMTSQHMMTWQLSQKSGTQHMTSWQLGKKSGPQNQGTNAIIIALILLSLDPIVKSGLHNTGV